MNQMDRRPVFKSDDAAERKPDAPPCRSYGWTARPIRRRHPRPPGCTSGGKSFDEACANALDAIRFWVVDATADGEAIPPPRDREHLRADPETAEALARSAAFALIPVVVNSGRPAKANLSPGSGLLTAIDDAAAARGLMRSGFVASAVGEEILAEGQGCLFEPFRLVTAAKKIDFDSVGVQCLEEIGPVAVGRIGHRRAGRFGEGGEFTVVAIKAGEFR